MINKVGRRHSQRPALALMYGFRDGLASVVFPAGAASVSIELGSLSEDRRRLAVEKVWVNRSAPERRRDAAAQLARDLVLKAPDGKR